MTPSSSPSLAGFAAAKVNLFLHVGELNPDGYHPLVSLMTFADVGDTVAIAPGEGFGLEVQGAFAGDLLGEDPARNLVWRAAEKLLALSGARPTSLRISLDKALPVAAGLGGGSSDAGAALKLIRTALAPDVDDATLERLAGEIGADGPACLWSRPVMAQGRGDRLSPAPEMPGLAAVLVNPRVACSTAAVYRRYDEMSAAGDLAAQADTPHLPERFDTADAVIDWLARRRNDLERPAISVAPQIEHVLALLRDQPQTRLARLSGSGATVFALCSDAHDALALELRLGQLQPDWWIRACRLGDPQDDNPVFTNP